MRKPTKEHLGDLLVRSLTEVRDGLNGRAGKLTLRTLEIPDPPRLSAAAIHNLRNRLGLSQALFARLLGISQKLVEAWEAARARRPRWPAGSSMPSRGTRPCFSADRVA